MGRICKTCPSNSYKPFCLLERVSELPISILSNIWTLQFHTELDFVYQSIYYFEDFFFFFFFVIWKSLESVLFLNLSNSGSFILNTAVPHPALSLLLHFFPINIKKQLGGIFNILLDHWIHQGHLLCSCSAFTAGDRSTTLPPWLNESPFFQSAVTFPSFSFTLSATASSKAFELFH